MTIPLEPDAHSALFGHLDQFNAPAMQAEPRSHRFKRIADSRFQSERMQSVQEENTGHELITSQFLDRCRARLARSVDRFQYALQTAPVQIEQRLDQFASSLSNGLIGRGFQRRDQLLDSTKPPLKFLAADFFHRLLK